VLSGEPQGGIKDPATRSSGAEFSYGAPADRPAVLALAFLGFVFHW